MFKRLKGLRRLLGLEAARVEQPALALDENSHSSDRREPIYSVPSVLKDGSLYAVRLAQGEMYDLGNSAYIAHFILYDRREKLAIDVTSDVKPAPLLSRTAPAELLNSDSVELIEKYLRGELRPQPSPSDGFPEGIICFIVRELNDPSYEPLRKKMVELRDSRMTLEGAIEGLRKEAMILKSKLLSEGDNSVI